jgi:hypothetical protein
MSLKSLLLLTAAAAVFLGYAQWRRRWMLQEIADLRAQHVEVNVSDEWIDQLWLRTWNPARIQYVVISPTQRQVASQVFEYAVGVTNEGSKFYDALEERCHALGVTDVVPIRVTLPDRIWVDVDYQEPAISP